MKRWIPLAAMLAMALAFNAHAHGNKAAQHGGVVSVANDVNYELVQDGAKVAVYITDHGKPVDTAGATAKLTMLVKGEKSVADLQPAGANKLESTSALTLAVPAKVVLAVTPAGKSSATVSFSLK